MFFPQYVKINYFCTGPVSVDTFVRNQIVIAIIVSVIIIIIIILIIVITIITIITIIIIIIVIIPQPRLHERDARHPVGDGPRDFRDVVFE